MNNNGKVDVRPNVAVEFKMPWGKLRGRFYGSTQQPLIVALHGWLDNADSFLEMASRLPDHAVLALDLAGHGQSDHRPAGVRYHLVDNVDDVMSVVDLMGVKQYTLLAHSMSAGFSPYLAAVDKRVEKLALVEGLGSQSNGPDRAVATLRNAVVEQKRAIRARMPVYADLAAAVEARTSVVGRISAQAALTLCARGIKPVEGGVTWSSDPRLRTSSALRFPEEFIGAFLEALEMPVLLILGNESAIKIEPLHAARIDKVKDMRVEKLPGNHHLHLERDTVDALAAVVRDFLG